MDDFLIRKLPLPAVQVETVFFRRRHRAFYAYSAVYIKQATYTLGEMVFMGALMPLAFLYEYLLPCFSILTKVMKNNEESTRLVSCRHLIGQLHDDDI